MKNIIEIPQNFNIQKLFGNYDSNIKNIEKQTSTTIFLRDNSIIVEGDNSKLATEIIDTMIKSIQKDENTDAQRLTYLTEMGLSGRRSENEDFCENVEKDIICYTHRGRPIRPKTQGQSQYVKKIRTNSMVFGIGPAGTGKTYIACAMAVNSLKNKEVERIILTRPAVEAGERLGFLPGDMQEKVDPYLRPLYDAIYDVLGSDASLKLKEKGSIEVVPLAYMRGRTLDNSFIILDEAQNTTIEQMKMFLTRMGYNSKVVVTGDITQIDLPKGVMSGLKNAESVLKKVEGIEFSYFSEIDVVRHELVKKIIKAYEEHDNKHRGR